MGAAPGSGGRDDRGGSPFDRRRARARPASLAAPGKNVRYRKRAVAGKPAPTYAFRVIFTLIFFTKGIAMIVLLPVLEALTTVIAYKITKELLDD